MRHPLEKFMRIELLSLGVAILVGIVALIQGYYLLINMSLYLIAIGLFCEALIDWHTHHTAHAGKQLLRGLMISLFATYLLFIAG